jgi:mxaK protein
MKNPRVLPLTRWLLAAAAVLVLAAAADGALWWRDAGRNALIASGQAPADSPVPELQFAHAQALTAAIGPGGNADPGQLDVALNAWRALQSHATLGTAARFNSANLLLRQASALGVGIQAGQTEQTGQAGQAGQALPLIELAKEQYRGLLRRDPGFWDARYNLERAQRLLPDPVDSDLEPTAAQRERERSATTMRAQSLGLP